MGYFQYAVHPFQLLCVNRSALPANASGPADSGRRLGVEDGRETYFHRLYRESAFAGSSTGGAEAAHRFLALRSIHRGGSSAPDTKEGGL